MKIRPRPQAIEWEVQMLGHAVWRWRCGFGGGLAGLVLDSSQAYQDGPTRYLAAWQSPQDIHWLEGEFESFQEAKTAALLAMLAGQLEASRAAQRIRR